MHEKEVLTRNQQPRKIKAVDGADRQVSVSAERRGHAGEHMFLLVVPCAVLHKRKEREEPIFCANRISLNT